MHKAIFGINCFGQTAHFTFVNKQSPVLGIFIFFKTKCKIDCLCMYAQPVHFTGGLQVYRRLLEQNSGGNESRFLIFY
jgi:hypothetical protein